MNQIAIQIEAQQLIKKFIDEINESDFHVPKFISGVSTKSKKYSKILEEETFNLAKCCAIVAVNKLIDCSDSYDYYNATIASQVNYWKNVKTEIQNSKYEK